MFSNRKDNKKNTSTAKVGVSEAQVLGINPTQDQLQGIIGDSASKFNTSYERKPTMYSDGKDVQGVSFWFKNLEGEVSPVIKTINLINEEVVSKAGNTKQYFCITKGSGAKGDYSIFGTRYLPSEVNGQQVAPGVSLKMTSAGGNEYTLDVLHAARVGEARYYDLIYKMIGWREDESFMSAMVDEGLNFDNVYGGDFNGLHGLVEYIQEDNLSFVALFTAKLTDTGVRQDIEIRENTTYSTLGGVTDWHMDKFKDALSRQTDAGYDISNNVYELVTPLKDYVVTEEENDWDV